MGRGASAARLIVAVATALIVAVAQVLPQRIAESLDPAPADVLVGAGFAAVAVLVLRADRLMPGLALAGAAVIWSAVGAAPLIGGPVSEPILRLALLPHALLVGVLASLPSGRLDTRHAGVVGAMGVGIAIVAGTGRLPLPLAAVGVIAVASAFPPRDPPIAVVRAVLGCVFVMVDLVGAFGLVPAAAAAGTVDIALLAAAAVLPRLLDQEAQLWAAAAEAGDAIGGRLGRALQTGPLAIAVPIGDGAFVDPSGRRVPGPRGTEVASGSELVAVLSPPIRIDQALHAAVTRVLERTAALARGRAQERRLAADLERSRRLLIEAGEEERRDLTLRVSTVVGGRIGDIRDRLSVLGDLPSLLARADAARAELLRIGAAPGLTEPEPFAAALHELGGPHIDVAVALEEAVPERIARVLWYTCAEALANAAKHAPGAHVRVVVMHDERGWEASVWDDGPGGADADGTGLRGLADRAAYLGGTLVVDSSPAGSGLTVRIPDEDHSPDAAVSLCTATGNPRSAQRDRNLASRP